MILFESWTELWRILVSALLVYPFVIFSVRITGKRSTSKMNNFDWVVTVALGSIVGSAIILKDVVIVEVYLAMGALLGLQYLVTKAPVHWPFVTRYIRDEPTLLFFEGDFNEAGLVRERITRKEVASAVRHAGFGDLGAVRAVVMEADASMSVLGKEWGDVRSGASDRDNLLHDLEGGREQEEVG